MMLRNQKGQSVIEYAVLVAVVISAFIVSSFFMRRGVMGKMRESTEQIGEQFNPFEYEARALKKSSASDAAETGFATGASKTHINNQEQKVLSGTETVAGDMKDDKFFN